MENEIRNALEGIRCEDDLEMNTLAFLEKQRQKRTSKTPAFPVWRLAPILAVLVLAFSAFTVQYLRAPVAYVSIDINPSIELALNRLGTVASAEAYNDDGDRVLQSVSLKGLKMTDALEQLLSSETMQTFLTQENDLTFTVAAKDARWEEELLAAIEENPLCRENQGVSCHGEMDLIEEAHEVGMSMGKYCASLELCQYDSTMTVEQCADMTMAQIHNAIREHCESGSGSSGHSGGHWGHGSTGGSHGNGHGH